ncbi:MAG: hypothetical protein ABL949_16795 [Fimbriimonadaceae bacterium]
MPREMRGFVEAELRQWVVTCPCGHARSVWDLRALRFIHQSLGRAAVSDALSALAAGGIHSRKQPSCQWLLLRLTITPCHGIKSSMWLAES